MRGVSEMNKYIDSMVTKGIFFSTIIVFLFFQALPGFSASEGGESKTDFIIPHVQDAHEWHFATIGHTHISIPLPVFFECLTTAAPLIFICAPLSF